MARLMLGRIIHRFKDVIRISRKYSRHYPQPETAMLQRPKRRLRQIAFKNFSMCCWATATESLPGGSHYMPTIQNLAI